MKYEKRAQGVEWARYYVGPPVADQNSATDGGKSSLSEGENNVG